MPYKIDTLRIKLPKKKGYDRRFKLTDQQRDEIRENMEGLSQTKLAYKYKVSRSLIRFIHNPEKYEISRAQRKERAKDGRYYDKEANREAIKKTRRYRQDVLGNKKKLFTKKQLTECIYCGQQEKKPNLHFISSCCGRGMCEECYRNLVGTDEQIQMAYFDTDPEDEEIIKKCGREHADYICFHCFSNRAYYAK